MGMHVIHEDLPGYSRDQILFDGCAECEGRRDPLAALNAYEDHVIEDAWERAVTWRRGMTPLHISETEVPLLETIAAFATLLDRAGVLPFGDVPPIAKNRSN